MPDLPLPSNPGGSQNGVFHWLMEHPKVWGLVTLVALAITFSPKVSAGGMWCCFVLAEITFIGLGLSIAKRKNRPEWKWAFIFGVVGLFSFGGLGVWLSTGKSEAITRNAYEAMNNERLADEAMSMSAKIRRLRSDSEDASRDLSTKQMATGPSEGKSKEENEKRFRDNSKKLVDLTETFNQKYYSTYRTDAKLIREAMLDRLASTLHDHNVDASYDDTGYWQMLRVADDLEVLAKTLYPKASAHP
jgi:hypothetical protein